MPVSSSSTSFSVTSIEQPCESTLKPAGVSGHLSTPSGTPSPSASLGQPSVSTLAPFTVPGHLSMPSSTPSPSPSLGQPLASTVAPFFVSGQVSMPSNTPSPSASLGQPVAFTVAPSGVASHWSRPSNTLSPSVSSGQPVASTLAPFGVPGHLSCLSGTPSASVSRGVPPSANVRPTPRIMLCRFSFGPLLLSVWKETSRASKRRPSPSVIHMLMPPPNSMVPSEVFSPFEGFACVQPPPTKKYGLPQRPRAGDSTRLPLACDQSKSCPPDTSSLVPVNPPAASNPYHDLEYQPARAPTCRSSVSGMLLPGKRILPSKMV